MGRLWLAASATFLASTGCVLDDVDLERRACPCGVGWVCDEPRGVCVRGGTVRDDGGTDAGQPPDPDGGRRDAGPIDASRIDAWSPFDAGALDAWSPMDAAPVDSGPGDSGPRDSGPRDSGPPDSGPPDSGPPDAGPPDSTACDDLYLGARFCDGFEDTAFGAWGWRREESGVVTRTTSRVYRGTGAMRATTSAGSGKASLGASITPIGSGDVWFRIYAFIPSGYTMDTVSFIAVTEGVDPWIGTALQAVTMDRAHAWVGPEGRAFTVSNRVPRDRWFCYRGHLRLSDTAGILEAWIDGTRVISQTGIDTMPATAHADVVVGIEWSSSSQSTADVYIDEVVVDDAEILCD